MFVLNGTPLALDVPFTGPDGTQYPSNWLRCATEEERSAVGIREIPEPDFYDQRFYWGYDQDGKLIPKDHEQLVAFWVSQTRVTANAFLAPTDWLIVREADNGTPCPTDMKTWRENVRLASNQKVLDIEATATTEELAAYIANGNYSSWPQTPSNNPG